MIEIQNISKIYPGAKTKALDDLSLTILSGEFFGLLGPNGARYILKVISTTSAPTSTGIRV